MIVDFKLFENKYADIIDAASNGDHEAIETYIQQGKDINYQNRNGSTILIIAADIKNAYIIKLCLDANADVNLLDNKGDSVLVKTLNQSSNIGVDYNILDMLLKTNVNINIKKYGYPMIMMIARNTKAIHKLIQAGADLSLKNNAGESFWSQLSDFDLKEYQEIYPEKYQQYLITQKANLFNI